MGMGRVRVWLDSLAPPVSLFGRTTPIEPFHWFCILQSIFKMQALQKMLLWFLRLNFGCLTKINYG